MEDEESEDNQLIDLTDLSDINNLESQFTDKLHINKLTLSTSDCKKGLGRVDDLYPKKNWYLKPTPLIYNLKKDIYLLIHLTH